MGDIQELINLILSDTKLNGGDGTKTYRDEPILKVASQLEGYTPPKYREMRKLALGSGYYGQSDPKVFYRQGKLMEDVEDNFDYHGTFVRYYPTYQSMSDMQLRGYFSWRTRVRRGEVEKTSTSFAFVYIYELLNGIGVEPSEEGFRVLTEFWKKYSDFDISINHYMRMWLRDYVVYYGLDKSLLSGISDENLDEKLLILFNYREHEREEVFTAINSASSYRIENSKFYRQYPDEVCEVVYGVYDALSLYYEKKRKSSFFERLFGRIFTNPCNMFSSAVFYFNKPRKKYEYVINDACKYNCDNGRWTCTRFVGNSSRNRQLGIILKTIDCMMRQSFGYSPPLKLPPNTKKLVMKIISEEIQRCMKLREQRMRPTVQIDISKLGGIRAAADKTRDRLIIDGGENDDLFDAVAAAEEFDGDAVVTGITAAAHAAEHAERDAEMIIAPTVDVGLTDDETELLRRLLHGEECAEEFRRRGIMLSVLADSVNEKLFDFLGDTAIEFDGEMPLLVEDYTEELKGIADR